MRFLIFISITTIILFGCSEDKRWDCIKSMGEDVSEIRSVEPFSEIRIEKKIKVLLIQDSSNTVEVRCGKNMIGKVITKTENGVLVISEKNKCDFMRTYERGITVVVHINKLKRVLHEGTGSIESISPLQFDTVDLITNSAGDITLDIFAGKILTHMIGTGDITLRGSCWEHAGYATGNGMLYAESLNTGYTWLYWNCTGNARIRASSLLIAYLHWTGDVSYTGGPQVISEVKGTGKLLAY